MPALMSLEGPRVTHLDEIRNQLYAATPRSWWRAQASLKGFTEPFIAHPVWLLLGIFGGMWLAGSKTGQTLIAKAKYKPGS
jgi:hypothetical protein